MTPGTTEIERNVASDEAAHPQWEELERVIRSETFTKSPRLAALLRYICERTWTGHTDDLSEQQIGIHFFHRAPGFNAGEDAIVRGTARHLRKRLQLFYETEGKESLIRISVPKGGYVARFEMMESAQSNTVGDEPRLTSLGGGKLLWSVASLLLLILIGGAGILLWRHLRPPASESLTDGPPLLWKTLFQTNRKTVIVPGDPALNLYTAYKHRPVPLIEYTEQRYQQDKDIAAISPEGPGPLSLINLATVADLKLISELVRIPHREDLTIPDKNIEIRYARDLSEADLHDANLILLGASTFDPWVSVYDAKLDFKLDRDFEHYTFRVLNRAPKPGEPALITKDKEQALTIIALTETPNSNEHVLLIEGSTMGSVYAALHFLFTQRMWQPIVDAAAKDGRLHNFEVLLKSDFVKDEVSNTQILAWHVH